MDMEKHAKDTWKEHKANEEVLDLMQKPVMGNSQIPILHKNLKSFILKS